MRNEAKKIWNGKIALIIVGLALLVVAGVCSLFFLGTMTSESKKQEFSGGSGYIISSKLTDDGINSSRQYFADKATYKKVHTDDIEFDNTSGETTQVGTDSFIHYTNGAIGILKKVGILDLDTLKAEKEQVISYYNLTPPNLLKYLSGSYVAELQGKKIDFGAILIKVSDNRFLIAAPKMRIVVGDTEKTINNSYVEVTFFDGDIIRVENQELTYQSISDKMDIVIGDVDIDLRNKVILKDKVYVLDLGMITVDSDDNIVLSDYTVDEESDNSGESGDEGEKTDENGSSTNGLEDILKDLADGVIQQSTDGNEYSEEVNEYERSHDPTFTVTRFDVTANTLDAVVEITDNDGLLTGNTLVEVVENSTNKVVYQNRLTDGETFFEANIENLTPDTEYVFAVTSSYLKDEAEISRTFVQKTFVTEAVGVSIVENYVTTSQINVSVEKSGYSRVKDLTAVLLDDSGFVIATRTVDFDTSGGRAVELDFSNDLSPNTNYRLRLEDFHYQNMIVANGFTVTKDIKTLKRRPTLGATSFTTNKREGIFNVNVADIVDLDNGIVTFRYEIYDARTVTIDATTHQLVTGTPVLTIDKNVRSSADVPVDGESIKREVPYVFRMVAIFYDNKVEREFTTAVSSVMKMDGKEFPSLQFIEDEVLFDKIDGKIVIIDDGGVFDNDKPVTVEYKDSVGEGESYTTTVNSSLEIPFNKTGLRKNESYVISIYGTVDLKDADNPQIDNCYIGSVIVHTKDTNPFELITSVDSTDTANAFSIRAQLINGGEGETEREANALSGITFNVYEGEGTSGKLVRSVPDFDDNEKPLESDLRAKYYDQEFTITPATFDLKNKDFAQGTYTIEITNAYDYTDYKNNIPINSNTITFESKGSLPDVPSDVDDAVEVKTITNGDLSESERRGDLNSATVVGYSFLAEFDNSGKLMKEIYYKIHTADGAVIKEITYTLPAGKSNPDPIVVYFDGDGTAGVGDNDFRRGNEYYVSYTVGLDTQDSDGVVDEIWPSDDIVLRSKSFSPKKQTAEFLAYPTNSDTTKFYWKYKLKDVDHAVTSDLSYFIDGTIINSTAIPASDEYANLTFENLSAGTFEASYRYKLVKNQSDATAKVIEQKFDGIFAPSTPRYNVSVSDNKAVFTFSDYSTNQIYNRLTSVKIEILTSGSSTVLKTFNNLQISNTGTLKISLSDMADLIGQNLVAKVYFFYDSGIQGFALSDNRTALETKTSSGYRYYTLSNQRLALNTSPFDSDFDSVFSLENSTLKITHSINGSSKTLSIGQSSGGILYDSKTISLKQIRNVSVNSNQFSFDYAIPGVRVSEILPDLISTTISGSLSGATSGSIKNNKLYLKVYKSDSTWVTSELVIDNWAVSVANDYSFTTNLTGLELGTNYFFRIFAEVKDGGSYRMMQLYDVDDVDNPDKTYRFVTLSDVTIKDVAVDYTANSQADRYLQLTYSFDKVVSVDGIRYEVWEVSESGDKTIKINLNISDDTTIQKNMTKLIGIPSGCGVKTGHYYKVYIIPYSVSGGTKVDISETSSDTYYFSELLLPFVGVSSTLNSATNTVTFKVTTRDRKYAVVGGKYEIEILDGNGRVVTPSDYAGVSYDMETTKYFNFTVTGSYETYVFNVKYTADVTNNGTTSYQEKIYSYSIRTQDVDPYLGTISAVADAGNRTKIRLVFTNATRIAEVKKIHYLVESSDSTSWDEQGDFVPYQVTNPDGSVYYYYVLPEVSLRSAGTYYIQLQFSDSNNNVLTTSSFEYLYMTGSGG